MIQRREDVYYGPSIIVSIGGGEKKAAFFSLNLLSRSNFIFNFLHVINNRELPEN